MFCTYYSMNYSYLLVGAGLGGITYYGYRNPDFFIPYIVNAIRYYHIVTDYLTFNDNKPIEIIKKRKHSQIDLICYNIDTKKETRIIDIKEATETSPDNKKQLKILKKEIDNQIYYKRLYENNINNLIKDNHFFFGFLKDKPFLQVEYQDQNKRLDIHLKLKAFYINRSRILDYKFLHWFMKKYYNYDITNRDYQVNIIDNNVNMLVLTDKDYIILRNDINEKYEIIRNEEI